MFCVDGTLAFMYIRSICRFFLVISLVVGYAARGVIWERFPLSSLWTNLCKFCINSFLSVWKILEWKILMQSLFL